MKKNPNHKPKPVATTEPKVRANQHTTKVLKETIEQLNQDNIKLAAGGKLLSDTADKLSNLLADVLHSVVQASNQLAAPASYLEAAATYKKPNETFDSLRVGNEHIRSAIHQFKTIVQVGNEQHSVIIGKDKGGTVKREAGSNDA
jgi:hypothetical protein